MCPPINNFTLHNINVPCVLNPQQDLLMYETYVNNHVIIVVVLDMYNEVNRNSFFIRQSMYVYPSTKMLTLKC
jgi:hypothetical protein